MTFGIEPVDPTDREAFVERLQGRETSAALLEVSIAALTTEPELQNIGRSFISLVRYHSYKMVAPVTTKNLGTDARTDFAVRRA